MRSNKRYSNVTITKRVDYEAGRHHTQKAKAEPILCKYCGALYLHRRWQLSYTEDELSNAHDKRPVTLSTCPACQCQKSGTPRGFLHISGAFLATHQDEIARLILNEVIRTNEDNPLARILKWEKDKNDSLMLETTTEHLAQRLGHALEKAFSGEVRYDFSHENKIAHVWWSRDE